MEKAKKWSATTRPSLVHKQSIRVVSATAIWPTSDLGPRIDRPPFVIPLRDILSFLVECRVILCGKRRREPGTSSTAILVDSPVYMPLSVQDLPEEKNHLHHSPPTEHVTGFREFQRQPKQIFITVHPLEHIMPPPPISEIEHCILQFQIKKKKNAKINGFRSRSLSMGKYFFLRRFIIFQM